MTNKTLEQKIADLLEVTKRLNPDEANHYLENMKKGLQEALKALEFAQAELAEVKSDKNYSKVTRVEVIDKNGRSYVNHGAEDVEISLQDDDRTMKIFCRKNN